MTWFFRLRKATSLVFWIAVAFSFPVLASDREEPSSLDGLSKDHPIAFAIEYFQQYRPLYVHVFEDSQRSPELEQAIARLDQSWKTKIASLKANANAFRTKAFVRVMSEVKQGGDYEPCRLMAEVWFMRYGSVLQQKDLLTSEKVVIQWIQESVAFQKQLAEEQEGLTRFLGALIGAGAVSAPPNTILIFELLDSAGSLAAQIEKDLAIDSGEGLAEYREQIDLVFSGRSVQSDSRDSNQSK